MNKKAFFRIYEIAMTFLALLVVFIVIVEMLFDLSHNALEVLRFIDTSILIVFIIDYFTRFFLSKQKIAFVKNNIFDLVAIIPFSSIFRAARLVRVLRITRLTKLTKVSKVARIFRFTAYIGRFYEKAQRFLKTNYFNYVIVISIIIILLGAVGLYFVEDIGFNDALWWAFVTATTVGYGDISPTTSAGRLIAAILMLLGIGFIGMLTGTIATYFLRPKQSSYRDKVINSIKEQLDNFDDLSNNDIADICNILYSLKNDNKQSRSIELEKTNNVTTTKVV